MKILSGYVFLLLVLTVFFVPASFSGDHGQLSKDPLIILADASANSKARKNPKLSDERSDKNWISNGKELGPWWRKNAKKYNPLPHPLLYHVKGTYSYSELGGNVEAKTHRGSAELTLRKDLFTSVTTYAVDSRSTTIVLKEKSTDLNNQIFRQGLRMALTDRISSVVGILWETNERKYLKDRFVYYGGVRAMIIDSPKLDLMMGGFYGYTETSYLNENMQEIKKYSDFPSQDDYDSDSLYFSQKLNWDVTDTISFSERVDYMLFLDDTEYYFAKLKLSISFKLTKSLSFITSYSVNYDNNTFVEAVQDYLSARQASGKSAGEMETTDTSLAVGIKFEF